MCGSNFYETDVRTECLLDSLFYGSTCITDCQVLGFKTRLFCLLLDANGKFQVVLPLNGKTSGGNEGVNFL